jgi:anti-anti-sigma factor
MSHALVVPDSIAGRDDASPPALVCSRSSGGPATAWVHLAGELDLATAPDLDLALREAQAQAGLVVLDLRELAFMDSCGVHAILHASIRARQAGRRLVVLRGSPKVDRMFALTGTAGGLAITDSVPVEPPVHGRVGLVEEGLAL